MHSTSAASAIPADPPVAGDVWMHFSQLGGYRDSTRPRTIARGEGAYVWDAEGRRYFDGLAALYCVNVGHGRSEIADAVRAQLETLTYFPLWDFVTPPALELSERIASLAPDGFEWTFYTSGGSEAVESAWKLTRQFHGLRGNPGKTKIVSRVGSYHGTTFGALSITGSPTIRAPFEPLVPGALHAPKVDAFHADTDAESHSRACADLIEEIVEREGPETVGAVIVEPVQNSGGCLVAEPVYFQRIREICDRYDLLFISDETICSWGRLGTFFGCDRLGYRPDIITTAKGITSGYVPLGALIASDRVVEPFLGPGQSFAHGLTFGGHPAAAAAALASINIIEREGLCERAEQLGTHFRGELETLYDLPLVGDVRGIAMFQAIELVNPGTGGPLSPAQIAHLSAIVPTTIYERGVVCRAMHRGAPVLQFAPPLVATEADLSDAVAVVRSVLELAASTLPSEGD